MLPQFEVRRKKVSKGLFSVRAVQKMWNSLPQEMVHAESIDKCKKTFGYLTQEAEVTGL